LGKRLGLPGGEVSLLLGKGHKIEKVLFGEIVKHGK